MNFLFSSSFTPQLHHHLRHAGGHSLLVQLSGCSPRFCSVSIYFLAWLPCTRHALFRSALPFGPLTGSRGTTWVLGNTTSPYSSPLICTTARLLSLREGGCLMVDGSSSGSFDAFIKGFTKAGRGLDFFWPVCLCLSSRERKEVKLFLFVPQPGPALWPAKEHFVDVLIFTF